MSRSATCMSDLIRQELSDYIDNKKEQLPTLSAPDLTTKNKLSYGVNSVGSSALKKPLQAKTSLDELHETQTLTPRRLSPELISRSVSPRPVDDKYRTRTSSMPSPPSAPKPPNAGRVHRNFVRPQRIDAKLV